MENVQVMFHVSTYITEIKYTIKIVKCYNSENQYYRYNTVKIIFC